MHLPHVHRRNAALLPAAAGFGALLLVFGLFHSQNLFQGLWTLLSHEDVLITDYVALCGIGPAFVNAGLVTLIAVGIFYLVGETPNGSTLVTISLMAGFSLFGKNILNIWPILFGTALYALWRREPFSKYVNVAMLGTSLAPMVSFMGCDVSPWLGAVVGLLIGFLIAPVSEYAFRIQNGMNLYSTGFACGLVAMIFVPIFKALGLNPASHLIWSAGNNLTFGIFLAAVCIILIVAGLIPNPRTTLRGYWRLLQSSGRAPSDYLRVFGHGPVLVNMGVNGLFAMVYILVTGGDLNGPTLGGIFTIMGFSAYGKHLRNIAPVMIGVLLGSTFLHVSASHESLQLASLFGTALAPFSGVFGWPFGVVAGLIHSAVVLQAGLPLEGMNLYNNGFSAGLVALVLYPVITSLFRHRRPTLQDEDLFEIYENDTPQSQELLAAHTHDGMEDPL